MGASGVYFRKLRPHTRTNKTISRLGSPLQPLIQTLDLHNGMSYTSDFPREFKHQWKMTNPTSESNGPDRVQTTPAHDAVPGPVSYTHLTLPTN